MKLFFSAGACSLAPHVALREVGADFEPVRVNLREGENLSPEYLRINRAHGFRRWRWRGGFIPRRRPCSSISPR